MHEIRKKEPNQSPEPTTTAVTSAAAQPRVPAVVVGSSVTLAKKMKETYSKLWREMLNSEMTGEYFSTLASRFSARDKYTKIFMAIMTSGAVAGWGIWNDATLYPITAILWRGASGVAMLTSIALPFLNYSKKVEWATALKIAYESSIEDYELIWLKRKKLTDDELLDEMQKIIAKEKTLSSIESHFPERDEELLKECQAKIIKRRELIQ